MRVKSARSFELGVEPRVMYVPLKESPEAFKALTEGWRVRYLEQMLFDDPEAPMWWCYVELEPQEKRQESVLKSTPQSPTPSAQLSQTVAEAKERIDARVRRRREREDPPLLDAEATIRAQRLKRWRNDIATHENKARYMILTDLQISKIAVLNPSTLKQLHAVKGIGDYKLRAYGEAILHMMIHEYHFQPPPYDPLDEEAL